MVRPGSWYASIGIFHSTKMTTKWTGEYALSDWTEFILIPIRHCGDGTFLSLSQFTFNVINQNVVGLIEPVISMFRRDDISEAQNFSISSTFAIWKMFTLILLWFLIATRLVSIHSRALEYVNNEYYVVYTVHKLWILRFVCFDTHQYSRWCCACVSLLITFSR